MTKDELVPLCEAMIKAKQEYDGWDMTNVHGRSAHELAVMDVSRRLAQKKFLAAQAVYEAALGNFAGENP
jgi:hypothetical protein